MIVLDQMERARAILQRTSGGFDKVCIMIDYVGFSVRNASSMKTNMKTLSILQSHYPETLGVAYLVSPPFVFRSFWKVSGGCEGVCEMVTKPPKGRY